MRDIFRGMLAFSAVVLTVFGAILACVLWMQPVKAVETDVILIDGERVSGSVEISEGRHTVTARTDSAVACIAVYENREFVDSSFDGEMEYDFPADGAEIALFCLDSAFRPIRDAVRVTQVSVSRRLVYSGEAFCSPEEGDPFAEYVVRLKVVTENGKIVELRDIAGYELSGESTDSVNTMFLNMAASGMEAGIIGRQSAEGVDSVTGATRASRAIAEAVEAALKTTPEIDDSGTDPAPEIPDGTYAGTAQCLTGYMNYLVDVDVTVKDGIITAIQDRTLRTPMSSVDRGLYGQAWEGVSERVSGGALQADSFRGVDAVSGATISTGGLNSAIENALKTQTPAREASGEVYAPEGISLYARVYPVVTVENGKITAIRIVPVSGTNTELLETFAGEIVKRQSVTGLTYPAGIQDDAFSVANLTDQILYGKGVLQ